MKYCDGYAALLDLYVDGELSPEEMARVRAHLDTCPGCQSYVDDALAIRAAFPDAEDTEVPGNFAEGVMAAIHAQAASQTSRTAPQKRKLSKLLLPLAACCAIVLLVRGIGLPGFGSKAENAATTADSMETPMAESYAEESEGGSEDNLLTSASAEPNAFCNTEMSAAKDSSRASSPYFAVLTLPADALEMGQLAASTPISEADGEQRYELPAEDYAVLLDQLDAAGIRPIAREDTNTESETALVIVTGL